MAHFIGSIQGTRGAVTRLGGKESGIRATVRGWNDGIRVALWDNDGVTWASIVKDGGSNGAHREVEVYYGPIDQLVASLHDSAVNTAVNMARKVE